VPVYVLIPDKVNVPDPILVSAIKPVPLSLITPLNAVVVLSPPLVKVLVTPELVVETVPAPASDPIVSFKLTWYVAPPLTVTAVVSANVPDTVNVPALIVVAPV